MTITDHPILSLWNNDYFLNSLSLSLDSQTGVITLKQDSKDILDREKTSDYYLNVEVRDNNGFGNRNTAQVHLILEDQNDNPPVFVQPKYEARIEENQPRFDTPLIVQVSIFISTLNYSYAQDEESFVFLKARDADLNGTKNHDVRYKIIEGDPERNFTIDSFTGRIVPVYPLDFEKLNHGIDDVSRIVLKVQAYDLGVPSLSSNVMVTIYVKVSEKNISS